MIGKKRNKDKSLTLRISDGMLNEIDEAIGFKGGRRSKFIIDAIREKLNRPGDQSDLGIKSDLSNKEKRDVVNVAKRIDEVLRFAIEEEAGKRKDFLSGLSNEDFVKLLSSRLPKESIDDPNLERSIIDLQSCLESLPSVSDITHELNKTKGELCRVKKELDISKKVEKFFKKQADIEELMQTIYRGVIEYVVDLVIRNSLPGFWDGGGLSPKGYEDIASHIKGELLKFEVHGVRKRYD